MNNDRMTALLKELIRRRDEAYRKAADAHAATQPVIWRHAANRHYVYQEVMDLITQINAEHVADVDANFN